MNFQQLKPEIKPLLKLAWPLLIAQMTQMMMSVVDTIMAGRVSSTDMAAVAVASSVFFPVMIFVLGVIMALPPIVSRLHGSEEFDEIPNAGQQAFYISLILGALVFIASFFTFEIFIPFGMDIKLHNIAADYLQYIFIAFPAFCIYQVMRQYCEGLSNTKPSMVIMIIGLIVNIPANYIFIYGKFGVPAYGGAGCGIATGLVFVAMMACNWMYVKNAKRMQSAALFIKTYRPSWRLIKNHLKIGFPIGFALLFEVTLFSIVALLLSPLGAQVVASHQIALNVSGVLFMVPLSVGLAVTIRIGFLLGENSAERAQKAAYTAIILGVSFATVNALISVLFRYQLPEIYTTEFEVIEMAANLLLLAAIFQYSDAVQVIGGCVLRGYKDTRAMLIITIFSYWAVGLASGYLLAMTNVITPAMGAPGFWIGIILGLTVAAILLTFRIRFIQRKPIVSASKYKAG